MTGQKVDLLTPVGQDYEDLALRMGSQIDNMVMDLSPDERNLKSDINNSVLKWNKKTQEFLALSKKDKDDLAQTLIDNALTDYNKLGSRASNVLGEDKFKFEMLSSKTQDVGKIGYAFEHAIKNFGMYQFVVLAGCILLDFVIVIIILLVTSPDNRTNNSVLGNRKKRQNINPK